MKDHYISIDQAIYATSVVAKYLYNATVKISTKVYKTTSKSDMVFTEADESTSDKKVDKLTRKFNIHYRYCILSLIYLLSKILDLSFALHRLELFSSNPGKVHFEVLVHSFRYIMDNKTWGLNYSADMKYATLSNLLRQYSIRLRTS